MKCETRVQGFCLLFTLACLCVSVVALKESTVLHEWVTLEFDWDAIPVDRATAIQSGLYIPENNALAGLKQWKDDLYVTVPRWTPGVISTLNRVTTKNGQSLLVPYPSYDFNNASTAQGLKYVQSMEIGSNCWMWIIDAGMQNLFVPEIYIWDTPRLVIYDMEEEKTVRVFAFEEGIVLTNVSFLNDIVIDEKNGFAYISDAGGSGAIIIYDFNKNVARRFEDDSMNANTSLTTQSFCGRQPPSEIGATPEDGIALTPDRSRLFYCALAGVKLFSLPTNLLRDFSSTDQQLENAIVYHGDKQSLTDGMTFDSNGLLYFGGLTLCSVHVWDPSEGQLTSQNQPIISQNSTTMQWPDTFGFDNKGSLIFTTNKLYLFPADKGMDFTGASGANFRILTLEIDANSYLDFPISSSSSSSPSPSSDPVVATPSSSSRFFSFSFFSSSSSANCLMSNLPLTLLVLLLSFLLF